MPSEQATPESGARELPQTRRTSLQETIRKAAEKRWEQLKGHELEPVIRSAGKLGGEEIYLPHTPTDWTEMRRIEAEYYGAPEDGGYDLDKLTPGMKYWMEKLPADKEYEDKSFWGKAFSNLLDWNPVKKTMDLFNYVGQKAELYVGYSYQAAFDPSLKTPEALGTLFSLKDKFDSPEEFVAVFDTLTEEEKEIGAAWWTGQLMYEATGAPFPADMAAPWAALLFELSPFGTTAKNSDNKSVLKALEPWETALKGFAHYVDHVYLRDFGDRESAWETFEDTKEWKELMKLTGLDWFFSEETAELRKERFDQFFAGTYMEEFGGLPELMKTRQAIASGTPPQQAIDGYYESLGIKRFEAEVQNMFGQIALDPLDWVLTIAKPGQVVKALGNAARLQRVAPQVLDTMADISKLVTKFDDLADASKITSELDDLAALADDLNIGAVSDAVKDARKLIDEGADIADVRKALEPIRDAAKQLDEMKTMSRMERISMALTGGDYLTPAKAKVPEWVPVIGGKYWRQINPIGLSAQARADEFLNVSYSNLHVLMRMAGNNVDQMVLLIKKASAGMFGGVMGHMFITPMGRHVQRVVQRIVNGVDDLHQVWKASTGSRRLLNTLAEVAQVTPTQILNAAQKGQKQSAALLKQISEALVKLGDDAPEALLNLRRAIENGTFTSDDLFKLGALFKSTPNKIIPYTPDLFRAAVIKLMAETAAEMGTAAFGVTEARFLEKAANNVKAVESLLLLGLNPGYPMMNFFNNEVTMIARGVSGLAPWNNIAARTPGLRRFFRSTDEIWETFGINPPRLKEGYGVVGDVDDLFKEIEFSVEGAETWALQQGRNSLRATRWGTPGKVTGYIRSKIGNFKDLRALSAAMEQAASQRAMTSAMLKMWPKFWKKGVGYDLMDDFIPDLSISLKNVDPDYARIIDDAIATGRRPEDIALLRKAEKLQWNVKTLMRRTAEKLGIDDTRIANFVSDEVVESIDKILKELGPAASPDEVREAFTVIRDTVEGHIDELVDSQIPIMIDEAMSQVATDGIGGVVDLYGNMVDDVTNRHLAHMSRLDTEVAKINKIEDPVLRNRLWQQLQNDADVAWRRTWNREEAIRKGIQRGLKERGITVGDEFMQSFRATRQESTRYIKKRNDLWNKHFEDLTGGKFADDIERQTDAIRIYEELDVEYQNLIDISQESHRVMDETFLSALGGDSALKSAASEWRTILRDMRRADQESVLAFRRSLRGLEPELKHQAWTEFHEQRANTLGRIQKMEDYGRVMLHGDEEAMRFFRSNAIARAQRAAIDPAVAADMQEEYAQLSRMLDDLVAAGAPEDEIQAVRDAMGIIDEALRPSPAHVGAAVEGPSYNPPIFNKVVGKEWYMGTGMDELWFEQGTPIYDMMMDEALKVLDEPNVRFASLPAQTQVDLGRYFDHVTGQMNDARLASLRMSEGMRDSALLNYGRRYNIDNWMSVLMPYGFWWTHSIGRWALATLEYPHMLASYGKVRQFLMNHMGLETNFPERLRGTVKIDIPWVPEEWGDIFVNPMRSFGLPFEQFTYPFEQAHFSAASEEKGTEQIVARMYEEGEISMQERDLAIETKDGPVWNRAKSLFQQDNDTGGMLDFIQMSTSLHVPISMAANVARGTPEKIGALPPTRTLKHIATVLGIEPGVYDSVIGNAREAVGLPAFDEWEDYRVDRELSNMAGDNEITSEQSVLSMMNRQGEAYDIARERVAKQQAARFGLRLTGLSTQVYPAGEKAQRELTERFYIALDLRDQGDTDALKDFFDENPEFEARLALFKDPAERAKAFLVDQVWNTYFDMPNLHRAAVKEKFGDQFTVYFLNGETRSLDSISTETLAAWVRGMKQEVPAQFEDVDAIPLDLAPQHDAYRVQAFYDERARRFPHYWELQDEYFSLKEGAPRRKYLAEHPLLKAYWDWKWDWIYRNPSAAPYLIDDPDKFPKYESIEEVREVREQEPSLTWAEWSSTLTPPVWRLVQDNLRFGDKLLDSETEELEEIAERLGLSLDELMLRLRESYEEAEGVPAATPTATPQSSTPSSVTNISADIGGGGGGSDVDMDNPAVQDMRNIGLSDTTIRKALGYVVKGNTIPNSVLGKIVDELGATGHAEDSGMDLFDALVDAYMTETTPIGPRDLYKDVSA